ncbi:hypothetical protein [Escherichia coli]|uniref:hypothetical protein n=1 Tax=Escherichia coli TaxID=562 RepID=UPI0037DD70D2
MSVDFCDARQGGGAYGKTPAARPFYGSWPFAGLLLTWNSMPDGLYSGLTKIRTRRRSRRQYK